MEAFELRGKTIRIEYAAIRESSHWDAPPAGMIFDGIIKVRAVINARRDKASLTQEPYAYIYADPTSAKGVWLDGLDYSVIEPN
jgi:hypothetical protein